MNVVLKNFLQLGLLALLTVFECVWLWFMIRHTMKWSIWVDRENIFWVRKGIITVSFAEKIKRIEKGVPQKILVAVGALLGAASLANALLPTDAGFEITYVQDDLPATPFESRNGCELRVPMSPGLGIEVDRKRLVAYTVHKETP